MDSLRRRQVQGGRIQKSCYGCDYWADRSLSLIFHTKYCSWILYLRKKLEQSYLPYLWISVNSISLCFSPLFVRLFICLGIMLIALKAVLPRFPAFQYFSKM